jgi:hypothetical protein
MSAASMSAAPPRQQPSRPMRYQLAQQMLDHQPDERDRSGHRDGGANRERRPGDHTSCRTSMSGEIPFAWIERPDGVK